MAPRSGQKGAGFLHQSDGRPPALDQCREGPSPGHELNARPAQHERFSVILCGDGHRGQRGDNARNAGDSHR